MQPDFDSPKAHIDYIRKTKFKLDMPEATVLQNSDFDQKKLQDPNEDLQNAVDLLSEGLYSDQTHFILELIQNAEDNSYATGVEPTLEFILLNETPPELALNTAYAASESAMEEGGTLLVINNEAGFKQENVEALCSVGKSTKAKNKLEGYIGEKGIGFKSVFAVSQRPHIFSNGYQFCFNKQPEKGSKLGYIVPAWVPTVPEIIAKYIGYKLRWIDH